MYLKDIVNLCKTIFTQVQRLSKLLAMKLNSSSKIKTPHTDKTKELTSPKNKAKEPKNQILNSSLEGVDNHRTLSFDSNGSLEKGTIAYNRSKTPIKACTNQSPQLEKHEAPWITYKENIFTNECLKEPQSLPRFTMGALLQIVFAFFQMVRKIFVVILTVRFLNYFLNFFRGPVSNDTNIAVCINLRNLSVSSIMSLIPE